MQTQQVNAAAGSFFFGRAVNSNAAKTTETGFLEMFQASSEKYDTLTVEEPKAETDAGQVQTKEQTQKKDAMPNAGKPTEAGKDAAVEQPAEVTDAAVAEQPGAVDEKELAERAAQLITGIVETVKEVLSLTDEQLKNAMNILGVTETDLLNVDVLKQIVLTLNGKQDMAAFLTDGGLLSQMQELTDAVEQLIAQSGLELSELNVQFRDAEFIKLFEDAVNDMMQEQPEADIPEDVSEQTETVGTKEAEISFKTEVSQTEHTASEEHTGGDAELQQQDGQVAEQFIQNLQKAVTEGVKETSLPSDLAAQIREIANQILEKVKMTVTPEMTSLEIQLTPEHLGKVSVTVSEQDGMMKASFVTENELAKEAIESNLIQFKQMMNEQGLKVDSIEVTVSDFTFDKNGQAEQSGQENKQNNRSRFVTDEEAEASGQDELALHFIEGGESTVNYMA